MPGTTRKALAQMARTAGVRHALRTAVAAVFTLVVVTALGLPQGYWAVITSVIVMQANLGGSIQAAWSRLAGTAVGAVTGAVAALLGGQSWPALGLAVFVTLSLCTLIRPLRDSSRVAGITVVIVILAGHAGEPAFLVGFDRFLEIALGIVTALIVSAVVLPSRASRALRHGFAAIFEDVAAFFDQVVSGHIEQNYPERAIFAKKDRILRTFSRCRQLRLEADLENRDSGEAATRAMLLFRGERLFEHVLAMDHVAAESRGQGRHRLLPDELVAVERHCVAVLGQLALHLRGDAALPDIEPMGEAVAKARERLAAMRRDRTPAAFDLSEVMHFFSFVHGLLACAADTRELVTRLAAMERA